MIYDLQRLWALKPSAVSRERTEFTAIHLLRLNFALNVVKLWLKIYGPIYKYGSSHVSG